MKVLILGCASASIYSLRKEIIKKLMDEGYETLVSVPKEMHYDDLEQISSKVIKTKLDRRGTNIIHDLKLIHFYYKIFKVYRPDCILTYTLKCNLYGGFVAHFLGIPYIMNVTGLGSAMKKSGFVRDIVIFLFRHTVRYANCVFFQNKNNERLFKDLHIKGSLEKLIPGSGVNLEINRYEEYPDEKKIKFLFVARIMHEKGIDALMGAANILKKKYTNLEFHLVGPIEEDYREKIMTWQKQKLAIYHGEQKDVHPFMKDCHALVHPSFYLEGMSNVCLEAAATGRPVITTNMPGCRETIDDGKTGFICQPDNVKSLVQAIEKFLALSHTDKEMMGIGGRKKMEQDFDRNIVVNEYLREIKHLKQRDAI